MERYLPFELLSQRIAYGPGRRPFPKSQRNAFAFLLNGALRLKIFITGASGYIGGSVAAALMAAGHQVSGLARSDETAAALAKLGIRPVRGTLDGTEVLAKAARDA